MMIVGGDEETCVRESENDNNNKILGRYALTLRLAFCRFFSLRFPMPSCRDRVSSRRSNDVTVAGAVWSSDRTIRGVRAIPTCKD